jgi:phosphotransferase system HPr (HPr) family protein
MSENTTAPTTLRLLAPLSGHVIPLEKVPDPVFAQRIVGDGVSIDPVSSMVLAPCECEVVHAHAAGHALTLRTAGGVELMIHVGVDTVHLKGEGFKLKVQAGEHVRPGQELIEFDADLVARKAKSLMTQFLVTNLERVSAVSHPAGSVVAGRDEVLELTLKGAPAAAADTTTGAQASSDAIVVPNPAGLHARPASVLAREAKRFRSAVHLRRGDEQANGKSLVSIMSLNVKQGDKVVLVADGPDAKEAVEELSRLLSGGLRETESKAPVPPPLPVLAKPEDLRILVGVCASPGMAMGRAYAFHRTEIEVPETGENPAVERARLNEAIEHGKAELETLERRLSSERQGDKAAIFAAHRELLDDPDLLAIAEAALVKGASAAAAWRCAYKDYSGRLSRLNNELLAGRAADIKDVGLRVLRILAGEPSEPRELPQDCIVLAEDLTPSDTANFDRKKVLGVCTAGGGSTSHVAILCRSWGLPALAAVEPRVLTITDGSPLILDAEKGRLVTAPTQAEIGAARDWQEKALKRRESELAASQGEAATRDGRRLRVEANVGKAKDGVEAARIGAEGVGLCRSEFLFLDRDTAPSEEEQYEAYTALAKAFPSSDVIIRTLDV